MSINVVSDLLGSQGRVWYAVLQYKTGSERYYLQRAAGSSDNTFLREQVSNATVSRHSYSRHTQAESEVTVETNLKVMSSEKNLSIFIFGSLTAQEQIGARLATSLTFTSMLIHDNIAKTHIPYLIRI